MKLDRKKAAPMVLLLVSSGVLSSGRGLAQPFSARLIEKTSGGFPPFRGATTCAAGGPFALRQLGLAAIRHT